MRSDFPDVYMVAQEPIWKYRGVLSTGVVFVFAKSKAEAIREATKKHPEYVGLSLKDFCKPYAQLLLKYDAKEFVGDCYYM